MKKIKIIMTVLSLIVMYQFAVAQTTCSGNKVLMSKGAKGCACHCQKKCVAYADTLTYRNNGWRYGNCWGNCCWVKLGEEAPVVDTETSLEEIFPNPASGSVTISFTLAQQGLVTLQAFDVTGRFVSTISNEIFEDDASEVNWDVRSLNPGIYFLRMKAGSYSATKRISVIK